MGAGDAAQWPSPYIAYTRSWVQSCTEAGEERGQCGKRHYVTPGLVKRGQRRRQEAVRIKKMGRRLYVLESPTCVDN